MKEIRIVISTQAINRIYAAVLVLGTLFFFNSFTHASTPNPGHPWTDIGNGNWQVANTQTATRTFTFPDQDTYVLATAGAVQSGAIPYGNGTPVLATTTAGTNGFVLGLVSGLPTWVATTTLANISGTLGLLGGGTNASLTASNGGILYSTASALAILSGTATAGQILESGASAAPSWSTATFPATAGTAGNVLMSNGTNWVSTATTTPTIKAVVPRSVMATGAVTALSTASLTSFDIGLVNIPQQITVNEMTFTVGTVTTAGTMRLCVYNEAGTNLISVVSGTPAAGANNVSVSGVTLPAGNYYVGIGCATTCSNTISTWTTTSVAGINAATVPSGKETYEGTGTMTSGTCNATLPTLSAAISKTPIFRLDN